MRRYRATRSSGLSALVNILEPDDVVLAEIAAGLNFDQFERNLAGIGEPMHGPDRDIGRLVLVDDLLGLAHGDLGRPAHHDPVLGAMKMLLQRENPTGSNDEPFNLKAVARIDRFVMAPGTIDAAVIGRLRV